ncbi:MAG: hypothetical protein JW737_05430 [Acidobacteria bacterium]|nr:hypothetical protein [Acidobacteriota bacterium]
MSVLCTIGGWENYPHAILPLNRRKLIIGAFLISSVKINRERYMKKVLTILVLLVLSSPLLNAAGFFNVGDYNFDSGFYFGASYTYGWRDIYLGENSSALYSLKYVGYDGILGFNLTDFISVYGIFGLDEYQVEDNIDGEFDYRFGGGIKIKFLEFVKIALKSGESESRTFDLAVIGDFKVLYYSSEGLTAIGGETVIADWMEYQGTVAITAGIDPFIFYAGGKVSIVEGNLDPGYLTETTFSNDGFLSLIIGGSIDIVDRMRFGVELSVFEETYLSAFLQFNF